MKLVAVARAELDEWLPQIDWHLNSFADRSGGSHSAEMLIDRLRDGKAQLWLAFDGEVRAVALTEVAEDLTKTVTLTNCAGGGMREWVHLVQGVIAWAEEIGSEKFVAITRPGWERVLAQYGFHRTHSVLEVDLDGR